ncbi:MAG TPA: MFS transporter [Candidatus Limnocylindrales bacterium]|nr:MFS transporter [Candidatus Limnocylindrales bacterium]
MLDAVTRSKSIVDDSASDALPPPTHDGQGRPTRSLPLSQLMRISLYWLGISAVWSGILDIVNGRLQFAHLAEKGSEGIGALQIALVGTVIAIAVQPTVGSISDYTITRWGRRKPYIFIGATLDVVFLYGIATSNSVAAIGAFVALLQFSSNFAQGPFQGYVPDLVPGRQVGLASGLLGLFSALGNLLGYGAAALAVRQSGSDPNAFFYGTMAIGVIEFISMLGVVAGVHEGTRVKSRNGRSWFAIAREAWGFDILRERSFMWLVGSRLFILIGASLYPVLSTFYLAQVFGLDAQQTGDTKIILLGIVAACLTVAVIPAARLSDRLGRKNIIYGSCVMGAIGLGLGAVAPSLPIAMLGAGLFALSAGAFLAVDWALMSDIVPKASTGRYMGISNVATASAGTVALAVGGAAVMDTVNNWLGYGAGPRAALLLGVFCYALGAILLHPVVERRREDAPAPAGAAI